MDNVSDSEVIYHALMYWRNNIQTGVQTMSTVQAVQSGRVDEIRMLSHSQQEFVIRLEELMQSALENKTTT